VPEEFLRLNSPVIATEDVPLCPVCGSAEFSEFAVGFDYELLTCRNPWRFVQCAACQHVWLNPRPAVSELTTIYPSSYYAYNYSKINRVAREAKEWLDRRKIAKILRACGQRPRSYLDVGCGDGRFLRALERFGVPRSKLYGLELDQAVVDRLRGEGYTGVFRERAEDSASIPDGQIDLVTMFHVIEHVDDPGAVLRRISRWLSPAGVLAFETPNLESWDARIFQRTYWGGYHIPRHWNLFMPATVSRLLDRNGFQVVATIYQTGHSFWMYSLHHLTRYQGRSRPRLGQLFDPVKSLLGISAFTALDLARGACGASTSAMLVVCTKKSACSLEPEGDSN
jgi:2-polyprenyl-3-methyl-5-hydroxy-6-metoxy-1,4-benzoquinol methylase